MCYAVAGFLEGVYLWKTSAATGKGFWETSLGSSLGLATLNPGSGLSGSQIVFSTGIAVVVGTVVANFQTHSIPHRILRYLRLTQRTAEVDIWQLTLNSPNIDNWVTVRHHENGKVYQGWVQGYSDGGDERELLLTNVTVFALSEGNNELVAVDLIPVLYLGLDRKNAILELRDVT